MNNLIKAYVKKYRLIELPNPRGGILYEERFWKNPRMTRMWYSESEIKSYIEDMDKYEIAELQRPWYIGGGSYVNKRKNSINK